jgi:cytidylate kinase
MLIFFKSAGPEVPMTAITISREIGSKGDLVAEQTAKRLGYQLVDKNIIGQILHQYGFVEFKKIYDETGFWANFDQRRLEMVKFLNRVIETAAYHGNIVLLGRAGFAILKGQADVLNVRIQAPFSLRVQRVREGQVFASLAEAEQFVRDNDQMRKDFVNSMYAGRWDSPASFDLVIDTGKISIDRAVDWLEAAARDLSQNRVNVEQTARALEIDTVLLDTVVQVLGNQSGG